MEIDTATAVDVAAGFPRERVDGPRERKEAAKQGLAGKKKSGNSIFPRPPGYALTPKKFADWLSRFSEEQAGRLQLHTYREWPVINRKLINEHKPKLVKLWEATIPFDAETIEEVFLKADWGGSGKYKIMATEIGVPGCVAMMKLSLEDADFPPKVDPRILVQGHPDNKGYIEGLRADGRKLPGDNPHEQEEEHEMNIAGEALKAMADQNQRLMDRVLDDREAPEPEEVEIEEEPTPVEDSILVKAMDRAMSMVEKQADRISANSASAHNPVQMFETMLTFVDRFKTDTGPIVEMTKTIVDSNKMVYEKLLDAQRTEADFWRQKFFERDRPSTAVEMVQKTGTDGLIAEYEKFEKLQRIFDRGGRRKEVEAPEEEKTPWYAAFMENPAMLTGVLAIGANIIYNVSCMFTKERPKAPEEAIREAVSAAPAAPAPAGPTPEELQQYMLEQIERPFIEHFFDEQKAGYDGHTFAYIVHTAVMTPDQRWRIPSEGTPEPTELGRSIYESIRGWGKQHFAAVIKSYPPIWTMVQPHAVYQSDKKDVKPKFFQFIEDFMNYDNWIVEERAKAAAATAKPS